MLQTIVNRRSIRKYENKEVPKELLKEILTAGVLAPSSKNRQPWRFIVTTGNAKEEMLDVMQKGIEREKVKPLLPESAVYIKGAENTLSIMKEAPVVIAIVNTTGEDVHKSLNTEERVSEICNVQSIGAAIENMCLAATALRLGSLWICDTYFALEELNNWIDCDGEFIAALAIGYADEYPYARPRRGLEEVVEWRN